MNESSTFAVLVLGILAGMLMSFGLIMVFEFLVGSGSSCQTSLYGQVVNFAGNL